MSELKPCSHCGKSECIVLTNAKGEEDCCNFDECEYHYDAIDNSECLYVAAVCDVRKGGCGASGGYRPSKEQAIEAWNTRANPIPDTPEMVRALDDAYNAGLAEAKERTCKMIPFVEEDDSVFIVNCSECGDAIFARGGEHNCNFCPSCGAKVVSE